MLNPFIDIIMLVLNLLNTGLFIWIIINLLIHFDVINAYQPLVAKIRFFLDQVFNPLLRPIRQVVPLIGGIDLSPLVLILILRFIESAILNWL